MPRKTQPTPIPAAPTVPDTGPFEDLRSRIHVIRGLHVMLDEDLARLYGVGVKVLNQAVKRNLARFPSEFCFQLTPKEFEGLRSHFATLNEDHPEQGALRSQFGEG